MAPARELAFQIFNEAKKFSKALGIRVACVYGTFQPVDRQKIFLLLSYRLI